MGIQLTIDNPGFGELEYDGTQVSTADPGAGKWLTNAGDTRLDISQLTRSGMSLRAVLAQFENGATVYIRVSGLDRIYSVQSMTDHTDWFELDVTLESDATGFALSVGDIHSMLLQLPKGTGGSGVTDHGALTGLSDDDHGLYLTNARGDVRYYTQAQITSLLAGKSDTGHDHAGVYSPVGHDHDADYSPLGHNHDHNALTNYDADEHIDWTTDQGATNIDVGNVPAATTTTLGLVELAEDGEALADKAVQGNDGRLPTVNENDALVGTGTPSAGNVYVTADTLAAKTHTLSEITDAGTAAGKDTGVGNDDVPLLAQGPYTTDGTLTLDDGAGNTINVMGWGIYPGTANTDTFEFGGESQTTPRLTYFSGSRSNADSTKAGQVIIRGGIADGTNSAGGDVEIYGGTGASGGGVLRLGGYDNAGTDAPLDGDVRLIKGFSIKESAASPMTTAAGRGVLWPRTSDGAIMWTDSSDVDHDLTTGGGSSVEVVDDTGGGGTTLTTNLTKWTLKGTGWSIVEPVEGEIEVTVSQGSAPVDSWGPAGSPRIGVVVPIAGDYTATQITNSPAGDVAAVTVQGAINELDTDKAAVGHTQTYTTVDGVPTDTFLGRDTAGTGATEAMNLTTARNLLNVQDGSVAAGTAGDAHVTADGKSHSDVVLNNAKRSYPVADEALVDGHETTLANVATPITTVGAALLDDATVVDQRATLGLGTAALENVAVVATSPGIGDVAEYINIGGNAGLPGVDGSLLENVPTGAETFVALTDVDEPDYVGHAGEFVKVNAGATGLDFGAVPGGGDMLASLNLSDVVNPVTATQNLSVEVGVDVAAFGHTHDVLSNIDNTAGNGVILGRDTAGEGDSEELTPTEARTLIGVALGNLGPGVHSDLEQASVTSGTIFASLQTGQVDTLTDTDAAVGQKIPIELTGASGAWARVDMADLLANDLETTTTGIAANEVPVGTSADTSTYTPMAASTVLGRGAAGNIVAAALETSQIADDAITLAKIDAHTGAVAGVLGYGASGTPAEVSSSATVGHVLKGAGTGAAPVFGQLVADSYGTGTIAVTRLADGTDGELITWSAAGVATTVAAGDAGEVLTSGGVGVAPTMQAAPGAVPKPDTVYIETPVSGDVINFGRADRTQTIAAVHAVLDDGTSAVVSFDSGASRATSDQQHVNAQTCSSTTTGTALTKTANLTFDSGDWRWFTIGTVTGATGMTITVSYT